MKFKRPLLAAAVLLSLLSFILSFFFPEIITPPFIRLYSEDLEDGQSLAVSGRIYKTQSRTYSVYVYLKNAKARTADGKEKNAGDIILLIPLEDYEEYELKIGNVISADCSFAEFNKARNNGNYDEENYYRSLGIFLKAEAEDIEITGKFVNWPAQLMAVLKERLIASFEEIFGDEDSAAEGIFTAVVTGDKSALTEGVKSLYSENGIAHILAVSGLHISMIGMGLFSFLKKRIGPYKSCVISSAAMLLYCIMCGMSVSALRAVIMFIVHMGAYFFGKSYDLLSSLGLSAVIILLQSPFYILNSGFIFSFCAILSIRIAAGNLEEFLKPERKIAKAFLSSACVSVGTLPAVAYIYYSVPLYGAVLNLVVIPLMSFVLASALSGGIAGMISTLAGRFFAGLGYFAVELINMCCWLVSLLPFGSIVTGAVPALKIIIFYLILAAFVYAVRRLNLKERGSEEIKDICAVKAITGRIAGNEKIKKHIKKIKYFFVFSVMAFLVLFICINPAGGDLEIIMFDVDQGDGLLIITPEGATIMIDGGSTGEDEMWQYRLESALEYEGVRTIDYSVITHPDTDHISAVLDLLHDETTPVRIKNLLIPYVKDNDSYDELVSAADEAGVNVINICAGMSVKTDTVTLSYIHPDEGAQYEDANEMSAVISLEYGDFTALFTGDIGQETELELIEKGCLAEDYDLLKVAHHGSKYSSCKEFLEAVSPDTAIISAGIDNSYGHPADETLARLEEAGADIYVTSECGEIKITVDETGTIDIWTKF